MTFGHMLQQLTISEWKTGFDWPMAEQSSEEFASANPATKAQDAQIREPRVGATISLPPCSSAQLL
jgi:hypothetical protein